MNSTDYLIQEAKMLCDAVIKGKIITQQDITSCIYKSFTFREIISDNDFIEIAKSFDFNRDGVVSILDFQYLIDHISDLQIMYALSKISIALTAKACKLKDVKLTIEVSKDMLLRTLLYSIMYIIMNNTPQFIVWGKTNQNIDTLFNIIKDVVFFIESTGFLKEQMTNIKNMLSNSKFCSCFKKNNTPEEELTKINVILRDHQVNFKKSLNKF